MRALAPFLLIAVAGCAGSELQPPSLAPRAAEAIDPRVPVAEAPVATSVSPAVAAQLAELVSQAEAGDAAFREVEPAARQAAAAAGPAQSESWVVAQQALSALVAARAPVVRALGDLDSLVTGQVQQRGGIGAGDLQAVAAAAARVAEIDRHESAVVDELQGRLASR